MPKIEEFGNSAPKPTFIEGIKAEFVDSINYFKDELKNHPTETLIKVAKVAAVCMAFYIAPFAASLGFVTAFLLERVFKNEFNEFCKFLNDVVVTPIKDKVNPYFEKMSKTQQLALFLFSYYLIYSLVKPLCSTNPFISVLAAAGGGILEYEFNGNLDSEYDYIRHSVLNIRNVNYEKYS